MRWNVRLRRSKNVKLTHEPGTTFQYSNRNYTTLGLLIKVVSGQSYEDYVQAHVLQPLGMQQSFTHLDDAKNHGLATGHQYWFNRPVPGGGLLENRATTPTGLLTASVEDMSTWLIVHLNHGVYHGTRLLSASGIDQLHTGVAQMTEDSRYAMGWYETDINGAPVVTHNGDPGDFHSTMVISPSTGWGVVLLMNGSNGQARLDVPAYGVMAQLVGVPIPKMPSSLSEFTTLLSLALLRDHRGSDRGGWPVDLRAPTLEQGSLTATAYSRAQDHPPGDSRTHERAVGLRLRGSFAEPA